MLSCLIFLITFSCAFSFNNDNSLDNLHDNALAEPEYDNLRNVLNEDEEAGSAEESSGETTKRSGYQKALKCIELARFVPNLCDNVVAKMDCAGFCNAKATDALQCGKKSPSIPTKKKNTKHTKRRNKSKQAFKRIVGGKVSKQGEWPWMVSLFTPKKGSKPEDQPEQICGGAILSPHFILTAAHCTNGSDPSKWEVYVGDHDISIRNETYEKKHKVKKIIEIETFIHNDPYQHHDVSILQLDTPIQLDHENKGRLCLPDDDVPFATGKQCYVTGWGNTVHLANKSMILRHAKVELVSKSDCNKQESYQGLITDDQLCAGYKQGLIDACQYDSGGPLVCAKDGTYYSTGIVSWGMICASKNYYGIYTNVRHHKSAIINMILRLSDDL